MMDVEKYGMVGLLFVAGILGLVFFYGPDDEPAHELKTAAAPAEGPPAGARRAPRPPAAGSSAPAARAGRRFEMPGIVEGPREPFDFDERAIDYDGEGAPPASGRCTYLVQEGDTLGEIALRELGAYHRVQDLLAWNPGLDPRRLRVDQVVRLCPPGAESPPAADATRAERPAPVPLGEPRTYQVRKGDVLSVVAQQQLGSIKHTEALFQANRHLLDHPDQLEPGMVLTLPRVGD